MARSDGVGDFTHFEDIMKTLLADPKYSGVVFIPIVCFNSGGKESNYVRIGEQMRTLGIPFFYGKNEDHLRLSKDKILQRLLGEADQAIVISYDTGIFNQYKPYLKPGIPIKSIGEHERAILAMTRDNIEGHIQYRLGLGPSSDGIKIRDTTPMTPNDAWSTIKRDDPSVATQLLTCTSSANFESFYNNYLITPAYFNRSMDFISYLFLLGISHSLSQNIVVYLSGTTLDLTRISPEWITHCFNNTSIQQIEIYRPNNKLPTIIPGNPEGVRSIKILSGFYLANSSFDAIYWLSKIAGVSGDNTLERCISMNILPFYWSTNHDNKIQTLFALRRITQLPELSMSPEARASFNIFFDPDEFKSCDGMMWHADSDEPREQYNRYKKRNHYFDLDLPKMIESWPIITDYLQRVACF